jgi:ornithine cyclodeaminase
MLVLSADEVESVLDLAALVDALAAAMAEYSAGTASMPPRIAARVGERGAFLAAMPAYLPSAGALTAKLVSLFPRNTERPTHHALVCCFDPTDGSPSAVMDGAYLTAARTAAGSVLASRLLARADASAVTIIGTGVEARAHAAAFGVHPAVHTITIAGRNPARVAALVADLGARGLPVVAASSIREAVDSADIVCTTTHADRPVVERGWLRPGTHLNVVGFNATGHGEIDTETVRDALLIVESRQAALAGEPAGAVELHRAIGLGVIGAGHIHAEIGELVAGAALGRTTSAQLTLYRSVGIAVQDAAAAALVLAAAVERGIGTDVQV